MNKHPSLLANRMRPRNLAEFVGQDHLVGEDKLLHRILASGQIPSMIFWGPPGSGKTTLARIVADQANADFVQLSATLSGVKDVRTVIDQAKARKQENPASQNHKSMKTLRPTTRPTVLFVDEIHRFNKAQQDTFLPHVETGTITLIGATTENPSFEIISPLLSRSRVLVLNPLSPDHIQHILTQALKDAERGLGSLNITIDDNALKFLARMSNGDARVALNTLELAVNSQTIQPSDHLTISLADIKSALQKEHLTYDTDGDEHYNTVSAFIKSMRAGDVDAALYYLARMVAAGEDPKFIARRMVVFASEDIGMAQPTALVVANEVFKTCETIGYPECQINLAHGTVYLTTQKKDRSAYNAYFKALDDVKKYGNLPIPLEIRNAPTKLMRELGYGKGYEMYPEKNTSLLPEKINNHHYFRKQQ